MGNSHQTTESRITRIKILEQPNTQYNILTMFKEIKESIDSVIRNKETIKIDHADLKSRTFIREDK